MKKEESDQKALDKKKRIKKLKEMEEKKLKEMEVQTNEWERWKKGKTFSGAIFPFGKHKGVKFSELPYSYLVWIKDTYDLYSPWSKINIVKPLKELGIFCQSEEERTKLGEELKRREQLKHTFNHWINLSGHEFEREVMKLLLELGYKGHVTTGSDDGGIDIVLEGGIGIQCKNHKKRVSPNSIRDFMGSCLSFGFETKIFISSNGYSVKAEQLAREQNILALDLNHILKLKARKLDLDEMLKNIGHEIN